MVDTSCIFCKIAAREVPAEIVRESDRVVAFRDIDPKAPTHILLIPKEHVESLDELERRPRRDARRHRRRPRRTWPRPRASTRRGWRLVSNVGPDAGQSVFHLHFHLLGGRPMGWPPG